MKKTIMFLGALLLITILGYSQKFGVKTGINLMNMSHDYANVDNKILPGYNLSIYFQKSILPTISLRPEIAYSQTGVTFTNNTFGTYIEDMKLNNLKIYTNIRFKPLIPIYLVAGPYFGYSLSGTTHTEYTYNNLSVNDDHVIDFQNDQINRIDYGMSIGVGYILNLPVIGIFIEPRYEMGLSDLDLDDNNFMKNRNLTINAGILIKL